MTNILGFMGNLIWDQLRMQKARVGEEWLQLPLTLCCAKDIGLAVEVSAHD